MTTIVNGSILGEDSCGVSASILRESVADKWTHLDDILVGEGLVGFVVLGVLEENLVHVGARILVQLVARTEDNQRNLAVAQHRQFVRLLHYAKFPLVKGHLYVYEEKKVHRK